MNKMENVDNFSWKSEQMIENASKWSLAGDVALLNRLKNVSDFLLSETQLTSFNINQLLKNLDTVSLKLDVTRNEFHSLRNTQFIENRVYEDDEILAPTNNEHNNNNKIKEDKDDCIRDLIQKGLITINKYFDKIEVSVSDSEDEETDKSYILQPKDVYSDRPLPYLIGSQEWYKKWHVGLESESDSESEKQEDSYNSSSSNSDDEILKNKILGSETSSELEFNNKSNDPVAPSKVNDSSYINNISENSSPHDGSFNSKALVSNINFAEQLAAKLHNINTNTINKSVQPSPYGNLFSDEPPPLHETDRTLISNNEDLFASSCQVIPEKNDLFAVKSIDNQNNNTTQRKDSSLNKKNNTMLNECDDSSSEDDISKIVDKRKVSTYKPSYQKQKAIPFFDDKPPEISNESENAPIKKIPIGGEYVFGQSSDKLLYSKTSKKNILFSESSEEESEVSINKSKSISWPNQIKTMQPKEPNKKLRLFEDDDDDDDETVHNDDILKQDILSRNSQQHNVNLFTENINDKSEKSKVLQQIPNESIKANKKISLFDDDDVNEDDVSLFNEISIKKTPSLFEKAKEKKTISLFESDDEENKILPSKEFNVKTLSLFDDSDDDDDELFEDTKNDFAILEKHEQLPDKSSYENVKENVSVDLDQNSPTDKFQAAELTSNETKTEERENISEAKINKIDQSIKTNLENNLFDSNNSSDDELFGIKTDKNHSGDNDANIASFKGVMSISFDNVDIREHRDFNSFSEDIPNLSDSDNHIVKRDEQNNDSEFSNKDKHNFKDNSDKYNSPPPINLFDSNPPPDTEWDAKSDSAESDRFSISDAVLDHLHSSVQPQISSLFDDEPPSLDVLNYANSSSGIVKDLNTTRIDTDDSSFYPYASSSRRLSTEIYNEQQSQDSFFVTENSSGNINQGNLDPVHEAVSSKIDYITPSGSLEDLTSGSTLEQTRNELKVSKDMVDEQKKSNSIEYDKSNESSIFNKINLFQTSDNTENISRTEQETPKNRPSPGKLKHNLNINVAALRPGVTHLLKVNRVSNPIEIKQNDVSHISNSQEQTGNSEKEEEEIGNSNIIENPSVLVGLTKNRVKIPVKRRPLTRKARQEAARKSMTEFGNLGLDNISGTLNNEVNTNNISYEDSNVEKIVPPELKETTDNSSKLLDVRNKLEVSEKTEDENKETYVASSSNEEHKVSHKIEKVKNKKEYIFDGDSSSDDDFFKTVTKKPNKKIIKNTSSSNTKSLFSDKSESDSDSELFGGKPSALKNKKSQNFSAIKKTSIFDNLDDSQSDSDLFGSKSTSTVRDTEVKKVLSDRKLEKTSHIRKLQNKEVTNDDPLSALK